MISRPSGSGQATLAASLFGAKRCLFGSNFPIEKLWTDYSTLYRTFRNAIAHLGESEQVAILHSSPMQYV